MLQRSLESYQGTLTVSKCHLINNPWNTLFFLKSVDVFLCKLKSSHCANAKNMCCHEWGTLHLDCSHMLICEPKTGLQRGYQLSYNISLMLQMCCSSCCSFSNSCRCVVSDKSRSSWEAQVKLQKRRRRWRRRTKGWVLMTRTCSPPLDIKRPWRLLLKLTRISRLQIIHE